VCRNLWLSIKWPAIVKQRSLAKEEIKALFYNDDRNLNLVKSVALQREQVKETASAEARARMGSIFYKDSILLVTPLIGMILISPVFECRHRASYIGV